MPLEMATKVVAAVVAAAATIVAAPPAPPLAAVARAPLLLLLLLWQRDMACAAVLAALAFAFALRDKHVAWVV